MGNSKEVLSVEPLNGVDRLASTNLTSQSLGLPVKGGDMTPPKDNIDPPKNSKWDLNGPAAQY